MQNLRVEMRKLNLKRQSYLAASKRVVDVKGVNSILRPLNFFVGINEHFHWRKEFNRRKELFFTLTSSLLEHVIINLFLSHSKLKLRRLSTVFPLTHLFPMHPFSTPFLWLCGFVMFSRVRERVHWEQMG